MTLKPFVEKIIATPDITMHSAIVGKDDLVEFLEGVLSSTRTMYEFKLSYLKPNDEFLVEFKMLKD